MTYVKTAVSLQRPLFDAMENLAHSLNLSRSRLMALALEDFIRRHENQRLLESINEAYADAPDPEEEAIQRGMRRLQRRLVEAER
jgi:metal-responsive CopG/Arc/MetJ family transcriptional regulator